MTSLRRRPALLAALGLIVTFVAGCSTCGCASTPSPYSCGSTAPPASGVWACATLPGRTGTPPPVSAAEAASTAARAAGVVSMTADLGQGPDGDLLYRAEAPTAIVFVDAVSGGVLEVVLTDALPVDDAVTATTEQAIAAAGALVDRSGWSRAGFVAKTFELHRAGVAYIQVSWARSGEPSPFVLVNASTGVAFAFVGPSSPAWLSPPVVGAARAEEIALATLGYPGEQVLGTELQAWVGPAGQVWSWMVGLGVPTATQADVYEHGAAIEVNAVTGDATILKSDATAKP